MWARLGEALVAILTAVPMAGVAAVVGVIAFPLAWLIPDLALVFGAAAALPVAVIGLPLIHWARYQPRLSVVHDGLGTAMAGAFLGAIPTTILFGLDAIARPDEAMGGLIMYWPALVGGASAALAHRWVMARCGYRPVAAATKA